MRDYDVKSARDLKSARKESSGHAQPNEVTTGNRAEVQASTAGSLSPGSLHSASATLKRFTTLGPSSSRYVLRLQRLYGNRYVQWVLARRETGEQEVAPEVESTIERKRGGGQALDGRLRANMELAFGSDFSGVRVHTDAEADALNRSVNAVAFTTGRDLFFGQGEYNPDNSAGRELLAHELTHVVQQGTSTVQGKLVLGEPGDRYEEEADAVARQVASVPFGSLHCQCACGGGAASGGQCESFTQKREGTVQARFLQRASSSQLQRRIVCPPGVSEEEGTGCYEVPDDNASEQTPADQTPADQNYTPPDQTPADQTPADQNYTPADQTPDDQNHTPAYQTPAIIAASESYHPEEQDAEDASKNPNTECADIIRHIENLIEELAGRLADLVNNKGGDAGHRERFQKVQKILETLMTMAVLACKNGEYDDELAEEAQKWADKPLPFIALDPDTSPAPATQPSTSSSSTWDTVLKVVIALGLSVAIVATVVAALADPEPATKLALAGLSVEEISALGTALGFATAVTR